MIQLQLKEVGIDYPHAGETIRPGPYSCRITAPVDAKEVRVSVDDSSWQPCRAGDGHWWFDMSSPTVGEHIAVARMIEDDGTVILSQPRLFRVENQ